MKSSIKFGLLYALFFILWTLLSYALGMERMEHGQLIGFVATFLISILCISMGIKEEREKERQGFITYGQAFKTGMIITSISTLIYSVFSWFYFAYINTGMIDFVKTKQMEKMQERGMDTREVEQAMRYSEPFMTPGWFVFWGFIVTLLVGIIVTLIVSAIMQKRNMDEIS